MALKITKARTDLEFSVQKQLTDGEEEEEEEKKVQHIGKLAEKLITDGRLNPFSTASIPLSDVQNGSRRSQFIPAFDGHSAHDYKYSFGI